MLLSLHLAQDKEARAPDKSVCFSKEREALPTRAQCEPERSVAEGRIISLGAASHLLGKKEGAEAGVLPNKAFCSPRVSPTRLILTQEVPAALGAVLWDLNELAKANIGNRKGVADK